MKHDRISYADVENVDEHHVLSFVSDADVFSGFLPVVFFDSALMTGFLLVCILSFSCLPMVSVQTSPPFHIWPPCVGMEKHTCWVVRLKSQCFKEKCD